MHKQLIKDFLSFAKKADVILMATSNPSGVNHVAPAGIIEYDSDSDSVTVTEWFCPKTVANLHENLNISIVLWKLKLDCGYQVEGRLIDVHIAPVKSAADRSNPKRPAQFCKKLLVKVYTISEFSEAPHSDENLLNTQKRDTA